jgi:hypothetical protein
MASQMETWHTPQEMEDVIERINAQRLEDGVALIGWIGMLVELRGAVEQRAWVHGYNDVLDERGWVRTNGFNLWIAFLDNELFIWRQEMQTVADMRSNTYDGELGYEC